LGLYPVNPVSGEYQLCSPLFDKSTLQLPGGKNWEIVCHKTTSTAMYIQRIQLNGKLYDKNFITYQQIIRGGKMEIWLIEKPGSWGSKETSRSAGLPFIK